jgi:hypothetical protein
MSVLRSINNRLERMVEGVFGKAFKAGVQPVELAHKLAKEMADHKVVSVAKVYVPNQYEVYLCDDDFEHLSAFDEALKDELGNYLTAYAQREGWTMVGAPLITLARDDELSVGEFGIATRMVDSDEQAAAAEAAAPPAGLSPTGLPAVGVPPVGVAAAPVGMAQTVVFASPPVAAVAADQPVQPRLRSFLRGVDGTFELSDHVMVIGRSRRCDIVLADPNVSRQHAEVRSEGDHYVITDLDSTNGIKVNRRLVKRAVLGDGDRVELGSTELRFERRS